MKAIMILVLILAALFVGLSTLAFRGCMRSHRLIAAEPITLTPVPEPATYGLCSVALLIGVTLRRTKGTP